MGGKIAWLFSLHIESPRWNILDTSLNQLWNLTGSYSITAMHMNNSSVTKRFDLAYYNPKLSGVKPSWQCEPFERHFFILKVTFMCWKTSVSLDTTELLKENFVLTLALCLGLIVKLYCIFLQPRAISVQP